MKPNLSFYSSMQGGWQLGLSGILLLWNFKTADQMCQITHVESEC